MILELDKSASCFSDLDLDRERFHNYNLFTRKLFPDLDFNWKGSTTIIYSPDPSATLDADWESPQVIRRSISSQI